MVFLPPDVSSISFPIVSQIAASVQLPAEPAPALLLSCKTKPRKFSKIWAARIAVIPAGS